ncbi:MAG: VacJ family lipoprotein [Caulobacterales bacterium]
MRKLDIFGAIAVAAAITANPAYAQGIGGTSVSTDQDVSGVEVSDPLEGANRGLFAVHNVIDKYAMKPLALGYRWIFPSPVRKGVRNVLRNANSPVILVNNVLQGTPKKAGRTIARFGVNTTVGVLGIFDVASGWGIQRNDEDFGQTLGKWGVAEGPYLFIPVLGPSNARDLVGRVTDVFFDPLTYVEFKGDNEVKIARIVLTGLDTREQLIEPIEDLNAQSSDPYATMKRIYTANRRNDIKDGRVDVEALPDFDDNTAPETEAAPVDPLAQTPAPEEPATPPPVPQDTPAVPAQ